MFLKDKGKRIRDEIEMVKAVIVFVDVNGKKLDRGSEERDRNYRRIPVPNVPPLRSVPVVPNRWRTQEILGTCTF
jgi:hypothetical protein